MKRFTYPLQKIVDLKEKELEQAEWAYGQSVQHKRREEARLAELAQHKQEVDRSLFAIQSGTFQAAQLMEIARYRQSVEQAIRVQQQRLLGCEREVEKCQRRLKATLQESKLWNRMKERAREQFEKAVLHMEQKELDELATVRFVHRFSRG